MTEVFVSPILSTSWVTVLGEVDFEVFSILIRILPECFIIKEFGFKEICIPEFDNMKECYDEEFYKLYADEFKGTETVLFLLTPDL